MAFRLTPHERGFYPLFTRAAENIATTADCLAELVGTDAPHRAELARAIKNCEHLGDELTHEILVMINKTFIPPFDREDIYRLAGALDDVLDAMEEAADRIVLYRLDTLPPGVAGQVEVLRRAARCTATAMPKLEHLAELEQYWIDVNSLEEEADTLYRYLLGDLLAAPDPAQPLDVLTVLKTKEVVEILEEAADAFETVANTVQSIAVKES
jgi:predicted phosphate transport protein (TIGR00153 family)